MTLQIIETMKTECLKFLFQHQLFMILVRTLLRKWYHFRSPSISQLTSVDHINSILQTRLAQHVKQINHNKLNPKTFLQTITHSLRLQPDLAADVSVRSITVSVISAASQRHQLLEGRLDQDIREMQHVYAQLPFRHPDEALHHFSKHRGAPNIAELQEYSLDDCTLLMFNLPTNITVQDVQVTLHAPKTITSLKYDCLGLPAYAQIRFSSPQKLQECLNRVPTRRLKFGERVAKIRSKQDEEKLKLGHRRVVVEIPEKARMEETLVELSHFGRVMHLDWPMEACINPTVEQIKQHYSKSSELVRINEIHDDGTVESQYYPDKTSGNPLTDQRDLDDIVEGLDRIEDAYEHRSRFAKNIDVKVGSEGSISLNHRGYYVVTYSTYEEAQAFYMKYGSDFKMSLVGDRLDFQWDPKFRKQVLRQVDNEYLFGKKKDYKYKKEQEQKYVDPSKRDPGGQKLESYGVYRDSTVRRKSGEENPDDQDVNREEELEFNLQERIMRRIYATEMREKDPKKDRYVFKQLKSANSLREWEEYRQNLMEQKQILGKKSFDELAEKQIYGRVLPKDETIERIIAEDIKHRQKIENILIEKNKLITDRFALRTRNIKYQRLQARNNRISDASLGATYNDETGEQQEGAEGEDYAEGGDGEGGESGKYAFSTGKTVSQIFRERTAEEQAHYEHRYNEYIRSLIYEYMGVFHDKLIEQAAHQKSDYLNPHNLQWSNGQPFLAHSDVQDALQFRRDFKQAQQEYENYIYGRQLFKSSGLSASTLNANYDSLSIFAKQHLKEVGVVEEVMPVSGDNLQKKTRILNAQATDVDEEFQLRSEGGEEYLAKIVKYVSLHSNKKIKSIQKILERFHQESTEQESKLFSEHYDSMLSTGEVPQKVRNAFHLKGSPTFDDLLAQITPRPHLTRKELLIARHMQKISQGRVQLDADEQIELEKEKMRRQKEGSNSFAKDPSEIYVKDREGYYKVSRYRQI